MSSPRVPEAAGGTPERISLWVEAVTGAELPADGGPLRPLDTPELSARRRELDLLGGPPSR
jgi:hypothetical protein